MDRRTIAAASIVGLVLLAAVPSSAAEPAGRTPEGRTPEGRTPDGQTPDGQTPDGQTQEGRPPEGRTPSSLEEETLTVVFPKGDPEAGREAFRDLMCGSCHVVAGVVSSPPKVTRVAPVLGRVQARLGPGQIATSIISPSHDICPEVLEEMEGELSPMGDLSEALTVRQLVDLVAYIRSLGALPQ